MKKILLYFILFILTHKNILAAEKSKWETIEEQIKINNMEFENQCKHIVQNHQQRLQVLKIQHTKQLELLQWYTMLADKMLDRPEKLKVLAACVTEKTKITNEHAESVKQSNTYCFKSINVLARINDKKTLLLIQQLANEPS